MAIVVTMCKLFITLVLGIILNKADILDEHTSGKISGLIVNVTLPFLIIGSVAGIEGGGTEVLQLFLTGALFYCIFPVVGFLIVWLLRVPRHLRGTYICMVVFSNNMFMGFPVVSALFGDSAIFYSNIFHMAFNLMFFTLGMYLIRKDAGRTEEGERAAEPSKSKPKLRQILNNGVIASVLALVIYFLQIPMPEAVEETCSFIGNVTMPLSMLVIGSSIAGYSFKEIVSEKKVYVMSVVRLILMPLICYFAIQLFTDNQTIVKIVTITVGMPIASLVAMGTEPYKEQGKEASIAVVFTTICSMITIPVMCALLGA